jgi:hypothetical protein
MMLKETRPNLPVKDAKRVMRAQTWLERGQPLRALRLLQRISVTAWKHPLVEKVMWHTAQVLG